MSDLAVPTKSKSSRPIIYALVVVVLVAVVAAAWYAESLDHFFRLRTWDKQAPGLVVAKFLKAGAEGNEKEATAQLGQTELKPLMKDNKWVGYSIVSLVGVNEYLLTSLLPKQPVPTPECTFDLRGPGAAEVSYPGADAKAIRYRLVMTPGGWKISEILGGSRLIK